MEKKNPKMQQLLLFIFPFFLSDRPFQNGLGESWSVPKYRSKWWLCQLILSPRSSHQ